MTTKKRCRFGKVTRGKRKGACRKSKTTRQRDTEILRSQGYTARNGRVIPDRADGKGRWTERRFRTWRRSSAYQRGR